MLSELDTTLLRLEDNIHALTTSEQPNQSLIHDINSQIYLFDSLVESYKLPNDLTARYNIARLTYAQFFDSQQIYHTIDRSIRINRIVEDIDHMVDAQNLIRACIDNQAKSADILASNMDRAEALTGSTLSELATHRTRLMGRMKLWRYAAVFIGLVIAFSVYRLFVR